VFIVDGSKASFGQLKAVIEPEKGKPVKDVYTRWEAITDKQAVVDLMTQIVLEHPQKIVKALKRCLTLIKQSELKYEYQVISFIEEIIRLIKKSPDTILDTLFDTIGQEKYISADLSRQRNYRLFFRIVLICILYNSTHTHLTSTGEKNKLMIESILKTADELSRYGPNTTVKLDKEGPILTVRHGRERPIVWYEYMIIVMAFMLLLPPEVQVNWAESYLQSFVEGYDLTIDTFPVRCSYAELPIYGYPLTQGEGNQQTYTSCHLGMLYHMLISLYTVLFEGHEPKRSDVLAVQPVLQELQELKKLPPVVITQLVTKYLQLFFPIYEEKYNITDDYTDEQKEQCKREFVDYILSFPFSDGNKDEFETEATNRVDVSLRYKGVKRQKSRRKRTTKKSRVKKIHKRSKRKY